LYPFFNLLLWLGDGFQDLLLPAFYWGILFLELEPERFVNALLVNCCYLFSGSWF
jgi:hypothetical protein